MDPNRNAVLVLSTLYSNNKPFIVDFNGKYFRFFMNADFVYSGNVNEDLDFEFGRGTVVEDGCGALLRNVFWYFGGPWSNPRQVKLLKDLFNIYLFSGE